MPMAPSVEKKLLNNVRHSFENYVRSGNFRALNRLLHNHPDKIREMEITGDDIVDVFFYNRVGPKSDFPRTSGEKVQTMTRWLDGGWKLPGARVRRVAMSHHRIQAAGKTDMSLLTHILNLHIKYPRIIRVEDIQNDDRFEKRLALAITASHQSWTGKQSREFLRTAYKIPHMKLQSVYLV